MAFVLVTTLAIAIHQEVVFSQLSELYMDTILAEADGSCDAADDCSLGDALFDLPDEPYITNALDGFFKQDTNRENKILVTLEVTGENQVSGNQTHVSLSEDGTWGLDPANALKSSRADLASRYISFYSVNEENRPCSLQNLFADVVDSEDRLRIPLDVQTAESGRCTLNWMLHDAYTFTTLFYDTGVVWPQMATAPSWRSTSAVRPGFATSKM